MGVTWLGTTAISSATPEGVGAFGGSLRFFEAFGFPLPLHAGCGGRGFDGRSARWGAFGRALVLTVFEFVIGLIF